MMCYSLRNSLIKNKYKLKQIVKRKRTHDIIFLIKLHFWSLWFAEILDMVPKTRLLHWPSLWYAKTHALSPSH